MGKRIISQRRGRGTSTYRAPSFRYVAEVRHRPYDALEKTSIVTGKVIDIINCPGHSTPLVAIEYDNGDRVFNLAAEGIYTGKTITSGSKSKPELGNIVPLKNVPIGAQVFNIESQPGDGGKFMRSAGASALVIAKTKNSVTLKLQSRKTKEFNPECRAIVGVAAGGGRLEKPLLKAGKRAKIMRAKNKLYPQTSGVAMNAVDHPFGSGRGRHIGKSKVAPKNAPPGRNVGSIRSRRTGHKK
jgi:large subunit ribosomal protein L2